MPSSVNRWAIVLMPNANDPELRARVDDGRLEDLLGTERSPQCLAELGRVLAAVVEAATARAGTPQDQMLYARCGTPLGRLCMSSERPAP
jgi:hypothetical protein